MRNSGMIDKVFMQKTNFSMFYTLLSPLLPLKDI